MQLLLTFQMEPTDQEILEYLSNEWLADPEAFTRDFEDLNVEETIDEIDIENDDDYIIPVNTAFLKTFWFDYHVCTTEFVDGVPVKHTLFEQDDVDLGDTPCCAYHHVNN